MCLHGDKDKWKEEKHFVRNNTLSKMDFSDTAGKKQGLNLNVASVNNNGGKLAKVGQMSRPDFGKLVTVKESGGKY